MLKVCPERLEGASPMHLGCDQIISAGRCMMRKDTAGQESVRLQVDLSSAMITSTFFFFFSFYTHSQQLFSSSSGCCAVSQFFVSTCAVSSVWSFLATTFLCKIARSCFSYTFIQSYTPLPHTVARTCVICKRVTDLVTIWVQLGL